MQKINIKKGDTVILLSGKDKRKKGKILEVNAKEGTVVVEQINVVKRHVRATQQSKGGIIEKTLPLRASKVMVVCPKCHKPSRLKKGVLEGKKVRFCLKCKEMIEKLKGAR